MKYFIVIFVTAVVVFVGATVYYKGFPRFPAYNRNPVSTESGIPALSQEATPTPTPSDETDDIISAIKSALIVKHGPDAGNLNITVSKIEGSYAQGGALGEGGGAMWFAAKVGGSWVLIWDGNGQINCSDIASYSGVPTDMIPECWDTVSSKIIKR